MCVFSANVLGICLSELLSVNVYIVISGEVMFIALTCRESQNRCKARDNTSAATYMYEEVGVKKEDKKSHDIQLTANEAYAPLHTGSIHTSSNTTSTHHVQMNL